MHRLEHAEGEPRQRRVAFGQRGPRHRRQRARQHRGTADPAGRQRCCPRDRLDEHPFESPLTQLAEQKTNQELLLAGSGAAEQVAQVLRFGRGRSASGGDGDAAERRVDLVEVERRLGCGSRRPRGGDHRSGDANPSLPRRPAEERDADLDLVRREALEQ